MSKNKPLIKPVISKKDKQETYKLFMEKYKLAMEHGYYGEAELIVYAYLEDRLRSFLYYSDALDSWEAPTTNQNVLEITKKTINVKDISAKLEVISKLLKCSKQNEEMDLYAKYLNKIYFVSFDINEMQDILNQINAWRDYRNEVVHALLNKNIDDLHSTYAEHVTIGYNLARRVDAIVKSLKNA